MTALNLGAVGLVVLSLFLAVTSLKQGASNYFDPVAFYVVLGATTAMALVTIPWRDRAVLKRSLAHIFYKRTRTLGEVAREAMTLIRTKMPFNNNEDLAAEIMHDGIELLELGIPEKRIEEILAERITRSAARVNSVGNAFRNLSKYPPAFGLIGTVLGLVSLMRAIAMGAGSDEAGIRMAVALVATLYGLFVSNLVLNPIGEAIIKQYGEEVNAAEIALQAVLLTASNASALEAQEMINSYLAPEDRINVVSQAINSDLGKQATATAPHQETLAA